jgi:MFS family permease
MALTWPISSASDDIDRRIIGLLITLGAIVMSVAMLYQPAESIWTIVLLFVIGGFSFPLYAIASAYTNDWVSPEQMGAAASQLVTLYGFGAMIGPLARCTIPRHSWHRWICVVNHRIPFNSSCFSLCIEFVRGMRQ